MKHYAGIDVSLESASICVVDASGRIVREAKVASEPEVLIGWFNGLGFAFSANRAGSQPAVAMAVCGHAGWWAAGRIARDPGTSGPPSGQCRSRPMARMRAA